MMVSVWSHTYVSKSYCLRISGRVFFSFLTRAEVENELSLGTLTLCQGLHDSPIQTFSEYKIMDILCFNCTSGIKNACLQGAFLPSFLRNWNWNCWFQGQAFFPVSYFWAATLPSGLHFVFSKPSRPLQKSQVITLQMNDSLCNCGYSGICSFVISSRYNFWVNIA